MSQCTLQIRILPMSLRKHKVFSDYQEGAVCKIGIKHKIPLQQNLKKTGGKLQFAVGSGQLAMNNLQFAVCSNQ